VTLLGQGVGLGDPQRFLPTPTMLGPCDLWEIGESRADTGVGGGGVRLEELPAAAPSLLWPRRAWMVLKLGCKVPVTSPPKLVLLRARGLAGDTQVSPPQRLFLFF